MPSQTHLEYSSIKRVLLQSINWTPEEHRRHFRSLQLPKVGHHFTYTRQLKHSCRKWLMAEERDTEQVIELVVLEQLFGRLPTGMAEWVQCQQAIFLDEAVQPVEDHLVTITDPGFSHFPCSLHLSPTPPS